MTSVSPAPPVPFWALPWIAAIMATQDVETERVAARSSDHDVIGALDVPEQIVARAGAQRVAGAEAPRRWSAPFEPLTSVGLAVQQGKQRYKHASDGANQGVVETVQGPVRNAGDRRDRGDAARSEDLHAGHASAGRKTAAVGEAMTAASLLSSKNDDAH